MRLIDADALLEQIDTERDVLVKDGRLGVEHILVHYVREFVEDAPTVDRPQGWVPCSERLPELGETVLTFDGNCISVERRIEWIDTPEGQLDGEWWIDGYDGDEYNPINLRDGTAIAWRSLPEPWEGADDENY